MPYRLVESVDETPSASSSTSKLEDTERLHQNEDDNSENLKHDFGQDPFLPFHDVPDEGSNILSLRAITVGVVCGAMMNAANIYMGLVSGWGQSASIFGALIGFAILKPCSKYFSTLPLIGSDFGPRENNIVQTTATAAGGMSNVFIAAFPAMYQLNLLNDPYEDFWKIVTLTAVGGFFGVLFATPLRQFFVIDVARELNLIFPTPSATAMTIRGMHLASDGVASARQKMKALAYSFSGATILRVLSRYAPGLLWDWHPFTWLFLLDNNNNAALAFESWGWFVELTPAFIGSGMLVGVNVAGSFLFGGVLAWGIIGPILVKRGLAFGAAVSENPKWLHYMSYNSLTDEFASPHHPSPRYWLLWPGLACMIAVSFTELACQWKILWITSQVVWKHCKTYLTRLPGNAGETFGAAENGNLPMTTFRKRCKSEDRIHIWMWMPALFATVIATCGVMKWQYSMPVIESILALLLAFFFSFLAIQSYGATDIQPLTAVSKASQIVLGAENRGKGYTIARSQTMNLVGGVLASIGAGQASDLVGDFRVGYLLDTSPRSQWYAQIIGTLCAIFIAPLIFVLFVKAYPCIIDLGAATCSFKVPSAAAWRAVAVAVTEPAFPVPASSGYFALTLACIGCAAVLVRHHLWTGRLAWMRSYHPNFMVMGLAFITPALQYGLAMMMGALLSSIWSARRRKSFETYGYAVAAGFVSGEGIGGALNALLEIIGFSGSAYITQIGCPARIC